MLSPSFSRSLAPFHKWLNDCGRHLIVIGEEGCGKTFLARQLAAEPDCAAAHFCVRQSAQTSESATVLRSIGDQLCARFPNLVLPHLSTVTLLSDFVSALSHFLTLPLSSLPVSSRPLFIVVDDLQIHNMDIIMELASSLPEWLRLVVMSRPLPNTEQFRLQGFHELFLCENESEELSRFIQIKLPQLKSRRVLEACQGSWWYVDCLSRILSTNPAHFADWDTKMGAELPKGAQYLRERVWEWLPPRTHIYIRLLKSSRQPPRRSDLLAASRLLLRECPPQAIKSDLEAIQVVLDSDDPVVLSNAWFSSLSLTGERVDLSPYHAAWTEIYKTKRAKSVQDVVELAFHLAHSGANPADSIRTLHSVGAPDILLRCDVIDIPTTVMLMRAGATMLEQDPKEDFILNCAIGDLEGVQNVVGRVSEKHLHLGLMAAASRGHLELCQLILHHLPQTSSTSNSYHLSSALRTAASNNYIDIMQLLIDHGCPVDQPGPEGRTALRASAWAGHCDAVSLLLHSGATVTLRDAAGRSPLLPAAFMDHHDVIRLLLESGADVQECDSAGATALHLCLSNGSHTENHRVTVELLIEAGSDVNAADAHGRLSIHLAAFHGDSNLPLIIQYTDNIDAQDSLGRTALMLAASQGKASSVTALVAKGASVDCIDQEGRTALQLASAAAHLEAVDVLLAMGADEEHTDNEGAVALHYAAVHDDVILIRALSTRVTVESKDKLGQQPLHIAAANGREGVVRELLSLGASPSFQSIDGSTPLRLAAMANHAGVVKILSEFVTDWSEERDLEGTPLTFSLIINKQIAMVELVLSLGASAFTRDDHGRTAAHVACSLNDMTCVRLLRLFDSIPENTPEVSDSPDSAHISVRQTRLFETVDDGGRTPLASAVWAGLVSMTTFLLDTLNVDPNTMDDQGASPLSVACQLGHAELVVVLLRLGAEPSLRDQMGRTAQDVARCQGHAHIVSILQSASGSADSSGFGSMPASPMDTKSLGRKSFRKSVKLTVTSPRLARRAL